MPSALVLLAPGFEEIEAVTVIDLLRRAQIEVTVAALEDQTVCGSHDIRIVADTRIDGLNPDHFDVLILPGGQPGSTHLKNHPTVLEWVRKRFSSGKKIAAICAAPTVLEAAGITDGLKITSYPSESAVFSASQYIEQDVVEDGPVITSRGVGTAIDFALGIITLLKDRKTADQIAERILYSTKNSS
ncbi:MAG TPA: DJ-1/PfpI family protein [Caldithrix abyssi]|uniref:DJ-1/PfpI family protein n=1 Tax=Caldithrix abyssi TaxID=187145 RepID=A0A7V4U2N8_CALAY|nr:DJ-1/PfpI family protein [Caldithrix abyssi]